KSGIGMRRLHLCLLGVLVSASACDKPSSSAAQPAADQPAASQAQAGAQAEAKPEGKAVAAAQPEGKLYGEALEGEQAVTIEQVMDDPQAYDGKLVRVQGMVTDVCTMRGCWFEMAGERPGMKMRFKVRDGDMVFPPSAKGKQA